MPPLIPVVGYTGSQTRYVVVRDTTAGQDLYTLNPDTVYTYPASTTKLMTALLIYEYKSSVLDSGTVTFNTADVTVPGGVDVGGFASGDVCTWRDLLYALFVASAADACQCAARTIGHEIYLAAGSTGNDGMARFVDVMNAKATTLGMTHATYVDPYGRSTTSGIDYNKISARDLNIIVTAALAISTLSVISSTATKSLTVTSGTHNWTNANPFVNGPSMNPSGIKDANTLGGKLGVWIESGTHVNLAQVWQAPNGNLISIVTMNSGSIFEMTLDQQGIIYALLNDYPYLEVVPTDGDFYFNTVKMLVGFDGYVVDESTVHRSLTVNSVAIADGIVNASTGSGNFNSSSSYVSAADATDLEVGSGDVTIELWLQGVVPSGEILFFSKLGTSSQREWLLNLYTGVFTIFASSDGTNWNSVSALSFAGNEQSVFFNGATRHLALVKSGSTWAAYLNGERCTGTLSVGTIADTVAPVTIGYTGPSLSPQGKYDDFRYSIGIARYTANKVTLYSRKYPRMSTGGLGTVQTLTLTQVLARNLTCNRTVNQGLMLTHVAQKTQSYTKAISQSLVLAQTVTVTSAKPASNTLVLTQSATYDYSKGVHHALILTQSVQPNITKLESLNNFLGLFHRVSTTGRYNKVVNQTLNLTQTVIVTNTKSVRQMLALTQLAIGILTKPAFSVLVLTQSVQVSKTSNVTAANVLIMNQFLAVERSIAVSAFNTLGMSQSVKANKVLHASASNTLILTHDLVQQRYLKGVSQTLSLSQIVSVQKIITRSVDHNLTLGQAVGLSKTIIRHVQDTLVFQDSFQKYIGIAGQPYVSIPVAYGVLVKKKCNLILEAPGLSIVLPCPQFNDGEAGTGKLTVKRAMDGTRRIYRRDSPTSKLKYEFVMDRLKAIELRAFIMSQNSNLLKMTNHKGEVWYVLLTNSPFTFNEVAFWDSSWGNKSTVTLELEGTRVN